MSPRIGTVIKKYNPTKNHKRIKRSTIKTELKALPLFWNLFLKIMRIPVGLRSTMQPHSKNIYSMQTKIISDHPLE